MKDRPSPDPLDFAIGAHPAPRRIALAWLWASSVLCSCGETQIPFTASSTATGGSTSLNANFLTPAPTAGVTGVRIVLPNSDLSAGSSRRFLLGLLGTDMRPVSDLELPILFLKLQGDQAQLRAESVARWFTSSALEGRGVYVTRVDLPEPGQWGVEVQVAASGGVQPVRASFVVKAKSSTPAIGSLVPLSHTPTARNPADVEKICSARPVDDLHGLSIAEALEQRRPLVVLFGTPGFCSSQTCGPALDAMQALAKSYGQRGNFIHVEIYEGGRPPQVSAVVREWGLTSEPWLFLVDRAGNLVEKFEGMITLAEVESFVARLMTA